MAGIEVLGRFALTDGQREAMSTSVTTRKLLAYLAVNAQEVGRITVAGIIWPDSTQDRASMSLRTALARMSPETRDVVQVASASLKLADTVTVDLRSSHALAVRLLPTGAVLDDADIGPAAVAALSNELLPDWYDDWVLAAAEDWRSLRLGGLETQTRLLTEGNRFIEAGIAARAAIAVDPLRETAQTALMKVHIAEGNQSEALRVFDRYRALLGSSLGIAPTPLMTVLARRIGTNP